MATSVRKLVTPLLAIVVLAAMMAWMAGLFSDKIEPGLALLPASQTSEQLVVAYQEDQLFEPVPASVEARQATLISSRTLARITAVHVRAGDTVVQGQRLVDLEQGDLQARAQQAREQIRAVQARVAEASQNRDRVVTLYKQGVVAQAELDRVNALFDSLQAELAGARQQLAEAETAVSFARINSPIDGVVVERFAEPGDTASPGMRLLSLYNPLSLRIEAQVREQRVLGLAVGASLPVDIPALSLQMEAQVEEIVPAAEPGSRSFLVKARIPYHEQLLPGMYARLRVPAGETRRLLIPRERLVTVGQLNLVWVLRERQAYRRFVRVGQPNNTGFIEVVSGLEEGDVVLLPPVAKL